MTSAIEKYHAASESMIVADAAVEELVTKIRGVLLGLAFNGHTVREMLDFESGLTAQERMDQALSIDQLPTKDEIAKAIADLDAAHKKLGQAYAALSEIEKGYVDFPPQQRGHF